MSDASLEKAEAASRGLREVNAALRRALAKAPDPVTVDAYKRACSAMDEVLEQAEAKRDVALAQLELERRKDHANNAFHNGYEAAETVLAPQLDEALEVLRELLKVLRTPAIRASARPGSSLRHDLEGAIAHGERALSAHAKKREES